MPFQIGDPRLADIFDDLKLYFDFKVERDDQNVPIASDGSVDFSLHAPQGINERWDAAMSIDGEYDVANGKFQGTRQAHSTPVYNSTDNDINNTGSQTRLANTVAEKFAAGNKQSFTVAMWLLFREPDTQSGDSSVISYGHPNAGAGADPEPRPFDMFWDQSANVFKGRIWPSGGSTTETSVSSTNFDGVVKDQWHFVVLWHDFDAGTWNIQVDNGGIDSVAHTGGVDFLFEGISGVNFQNLYLDFGRVFRGMYDGIGIWHRVLTSDEKDALYNNGLGVSLKQYPVPALQGLPETIRRELKSFWRFNEDDNFDGTLFVTRDWVGLNNLEWNNVDKTIPPRSSGIEGGEQGQGDGSVILNQLGVGGHEGGFFCATDNAQNYDEAGTLEEESHFFLSNAGGADNSIEFAGWFISDTKGINPQQILGRMDDTTQLYALELLPDGETLRWNIGSGTDPFSRWLNHEIDVNVPSIASGQWTFFHCGYREHHEGAFGTGGGEMFLRVNDMAEVSSSGTGISLGPIAGLNVGTMFWLGNQANLPTTGPQQKAVFNGKIDALGYWRRRLSNQEIDWLYNANSAGIGRELPEFGDVGPTTTPAKVGGYISSKTPLAATPSGIFGGFTQRFQDGPTTRPARFGGLTKRFISWPVENPNTISSGIAALQEDVCGYWPMNDASGVTRKDVSGSGVHLFARAWKAEFDGDKEILASGLTSWWKMDEVGGNVSRMDSIGSNHLNITPGTAVINRNKMIRASGAEFTGAGYFRRTGTPDFHPGSGDMTVAMWVRWEGGDTNLTGLCSRWDEAGQEEFLLYRTDTAASDLRFRHRPVWLVRTSTGLNVFNAASGQNNGAGQPTAPRVQNGVDYFLAARVLGASGMTQITWASGTDWTSRIHNEAFHNDIANEGINESTAEFQIGHFGVNRRHIGGMDEVAIWQDRYLTDEELELVFGSGLGQTPDFVQNAVATLGSGQEADHLGPGQSTTTKKLGTASCSFDRNNEWGEETFTEEALVMDDHDPIASGARTAGEVFNFDGTESFTYAGWAYFSDVSTQSVLSKTRDTAGKRSYKFRRNNNDGHMHLLFSSTGDSYNVDLNVTTPSFINSGQWYFLVCGYDAVNDEVFAEVNRNTRFTASLSSINVTDAPFMFGDADSGEDFDGFLDAWGLWKRVLSDGELDELYNGGTGKELTASDFAGVFDPLFEGYDQPGNTIGGFLFSKPRLDQRNNQFFGGYTRAPGFEKGDSFFGGFLLAQPLQSAPTSFLGGFGSGLFQVGPDEGPQGQIPRLGGWIFGRPSDTQFIEQHSRTLVKVRGQDVVDQALDLDAKLTLLQRANEDFNARLICFDTGNADFNAKLEVVANKIRPTCDLECSSFTDASGVTQATVTASGIIGEPDSFFVNAFIDFGEPYGFGGEFGGGGVANKTPGTSISGFNFSELQASGNVVKSTHDFNFPGVYVITATFVDNLGQTHMAGFQMNTITSGSIASVSGLPREGHDYPAIEVSGLPRTGETPPTLTVDYSLQASGITTGPVGASVKQLNSSTPNNNQFLQWNFGNGATSTIKDPFSNYPNPGKFIPVARFQFIHPSGELLDPSGVVLAPSGGPPNGSGTLFGPLYGPKPIWVSDSLVFGYNR